jgi:hypothetical protein
MKSDKLIKLNFIIAVLSICCHSCFAQAATIFHAPPGSYETSWVGNSFGGNGGPNGYGYWVQEGANAMDVSPDGTVIVGVDWDEAGRCAGLYKNGNTNRVLLKAENLKGGEGAWGWNTGNHAVAFLGDHIYIANTGKKLLKFSWEIGNFDSAKFDTAVDTPDKAIGMAARNQELAILYPKEVEIRSQSDMSVIRSFPIENAKGITIAPDGSLWIIKGESVLRYTDKGQYSGVKVSGLEDPSAVAFDNVGRLIVCDNGARQQVLFYNIHPRPKLVRTFGEKGGIRSGIPGVVTAAKLFALRGAGTDSKGNIYVCMNFGNGPNGNMLLRSYSPEGKLRWQLGCFSFVDTFGFDPDSDGQTVYSRTAVFHLDLKRKTPGTEWSLIGISLDPLKGPNDTRAKYGCSVILRHLDSHRLLYCIGQYAGGYDIYSFDNSKGYLAHLVNQIHENDEWAWYVDKKGGIWNGDGPNKTIRYFPFEGWSKSYTPIYDWNHQRVWPWPKGWQLVRRVMYDTSTDTLYLTGYLDGQNVETWGVAGAAAQRYDGWLKGGMKLRWTIDMPRDGNTDKQGPLTPQSVDIAGNYLFAGMVMPNDGKQLVHVMNLSNGEYVGTFSPGKATGEGWGWEDMPYAIQATKRKDGEYLILVEEDWRGKNILYRWRP